LFALVLQTCTAVACSPLRELGFSCISLRSMYAVRLALCIAQVYELSSVKDNWGRSELLNDWHTGGGAMIMGYEMFRNLSQLARVKNKKQKKIFTETLVDPGESS